MSKSKLRKKRPESITNHTVLVARKLIHTQYCCCSEYFAKLQLDLVLHDRRLSPIPIQLERKPEIATRVLSHCDWLVVSYLVHCVHEQSNASVIVVSSLPLPIDRGIIIDLHGNLFRTCPTKDCLCTLDLT